MTIRMEHANLHVRHFDDAVRFLKTAFPDFHVRSESVSDGLRWMHIGTDDTYIALNETSNDRRENWAPYDGKPGVNHLVSAFISTMRTATTGSLCSTSLLT